jgi:hypothetical protein
MIQHFVACSTITYTMKRLFLFPFAILWWCSVCCHAFVPNAPKQAVVSLMAVTPPANSSKALTDYMAKSHEEKLRAVKEAEARKNAEIQALKQEIQRLKQTSSAITTATRTTPGSMEELQAKLVAYQQFMSKYIVKAQQEKIAAVKAAEEATAQKYKDLLLPSSSAMETTVSRNTESKLYMDRNVKVSQAGKAGKGRWGDLEVQRAAEQVGGTVNGAAAAAAVVVDVPPEVEEANHGLRADGGVGGPSLAERVAMGAAAAASNSETLSSPVPATLSTSVAQSTPVSREAPVSRNQILYHARNEMVSAAAKAGKGRWGPLEVEKATQLAALPIAPSTPIAAVSSQVAAADHGLRSSGGVGGPSLAERVNMGAQLLEKASSVSSLYQQRNAMVSAAAKAGKTRWGPMEAEKANLLSENALPAATDSSSSLSSQYVNIGAQLLRSTS